MMYVLLIKSAMIVNGELAVEQGRLTSVYAGKVLRKRDA